MGHILKLTRYKMVPNKFKICSSFKIALFNQKVIFMAKS